MKAFFVRQWFLLALAGVLIVGIAAAPWLSAVANLRWLRYVLVAVVLFVMAFPLDAGVMWRGLKRPLPPLLACAVNYGALPLLAWALAAGLDILGVSSQMTRGLLVASVTPCTLASAAVWTRRAGGNDAAAILVTIITNLSCFFVMPLWLFAMTGLAVESEQFSPTAMMVKLGCLVVLPMTLAQIVRRYRPAAKWATKNKTPLGVIAQCGVLSMVLFGAIEMGEIVRREGALGAFLWETPVMIITVLTTHLLMLALGLISASLLGLSRADRIAVGIAGSQKTLLVGLQVSIDLGAAILPILAYHVGQLLADTIIVDRWRLTHTPTDRDPPRSSHDDGPVREEL